MASSSELSIEAPEVDGTISADASSDTEIVSALHEDALDTDKEEIRSSEGITNTGRSQRINGGSRLHVIFVR